MKNEEDLEGRLVESDITNPDTQDNNPTLPQRFKNFMASTTAGWVAYTPIMAPIEHYVAGMDWDEVVLTRLFAGLGHLIGLHPYQKVREFLGKKLNVTDESSKLARLSINAVSFTPTQMGFAH